MPAETPAETLKRSMIVPAETQQAHLCLIARQTKHATGSIIPCPVLQREEPMRTGQGLVWRTHPAHLLPPPAVIKIMSDPAITKPVSAQTDLKRLITAARQLPTEGRFAAGEAVATVRL
jgi:hypothetical protein